MATRNLKLMIDERDLNGIQQYFIDGGNINEIFDDGMTPLLYAIDRSYNVNEETFIIIEGSIINCADEIILCLINCGADVHARDLLLHTPLLLVLLYRRSYKVIYKLIDAGSDIHATCSECCTPLLYAIQENYDCTLIDKLLAMGADVNHRDIEGKTALFYALGRSNRYEVVLMLIHAGAIVNACDNIGKNILCSIYCKSCEGMKCSNKQIINLLISKGAELKVTDYYGNTIIHCTNCNYLIWLSIKQGISVESKDYDRCTPLMRAIRVENFPKVKNLVLLFNANVNCMDLKLNTPLHLSVEMWSYHITEFLLYHGGNLLAKNFNQETPVDKLLCLDVYTPSHITTVYDNIPSHVKAVIKHYLLFIDKNGFSDSFENQSNELKTIVGPFLNDCTKELSKMQVMFVTDDLTFYQFCEKKKYYTNEYLDISVNEYSYSCNEIKEIFPIYQDLIIMRVKDNWFERRRKVLLNSLENIVIKPLLCCKNDSNVELIFDCKYHLALYLDHEQLINLFFASTEQDVSVL